MKGHDTRNLFIRFRKKKLCMWVHACVCVYAHMHIERKSKWGKTLTVDESNRFIYFSVSLKLFPNKKLKRERKHCQMSKWACGFFLSPPPRIFDPFLYPNSSPLSEMPPLLIHSFSFTCPILKCTYLWVMCHSDLKEMELEMLVRTILCWVLHAGDGDKDFLCVVSPNHLNSPKRHKR